MKMRIQRSLIGLFILFFVFMLITSEQSNTLNIYQNKNPIKEGMKSYEEWPMKRGDSRNTGRSPYYTPPNAGKILWSYQLENNTPIYPESAIVLDSYGNIYFYAEDSYFYTISPQGYLRWKLIIENSSEGILGPVVAPGNIIYLMNTPSIPLPCSRSSSSGDNLYAISEKGEILWKYNFDLRTPTAPLFDSDGNIYVGASDGLYVLNPNGTLRTYVDVVKNIHEMALSTDTLYIETNEKLYAMSMNFTIKWSFDMGWVKPGVPPIIGDDGRVYVLNSNGSLYSISTDGKVVWSKQRVIDFGYGYHNSLYTISYIPSTINKSLLSKLSAKDGKTIWKHVISTDFINNPVIGGNNYVYVATWFSKNNTGLLYYFSPEGKPVWSLRFHGDISPLAINKNGTLYVGTTNGTLYAIGGYAAEDRESGENGMLWYYTLGAGAVLIAAAAIFVYHRYRKKRNGGNDNVPAGGKDGT